MSAFKMEYQRISGLDDYIKNVIGALIETKTKLLNLQSNSQDIHFKANKKAVINEKMTSIVNKTRNLITESENMHQAVSQMLNNVAELDEKYNSRITGVQPVNVASDATMQNMLAQTGTLIAGLTSAILGGVGVATNNGSSAIHASHGNNTPKPSQANPYTSDPKEVEKMKKRLNSLGYVGKDGKPLVVNGVFDANALFAMNQFKNKNSLGNTGVNAGVVGSETIGKLYSDEAVGYKKKGNTGDNQSSLQQSSSQSLKDVSEKFWADRKNTWVNPIKGGCKENPTTGCRYFGAPRDDGKRAHAGIDFVVAPGTKVIAMTDGEVMDVSYFYEGTYAVTVKNSDGSIVRYCEVKSLVKVGQEVKKGEIIGNVIRNTSKERSSMLHLEVYKGDCAGDLTQKNITKYEYLEGNKYKRRKDLINPTGAINLKVIT